MKLDYLYWFYQSALSKKFCKDVIKLGKKKQSKTAGTISINTEEKKISKKESKDLKKYRHSNIVWLDEPWIYDEITNYVGDANKKANWNFEVDRCEQAQFTIYNKSQYYHWHMDQLPKPYVNPTNLNTHGKTRKLSVTVSLSDPDDYKGGNFEFCTQGQVNCTKTVVSRCKEIKPQGSIVVFPSFLNHRVTPVTKGTRYSLVLWYLGKPWK